MQYRSEIRGAFVLVSAIQPHTGRSLTNSAEDIIASLAVSLDLRGRRVLYEDSEGCWDELVHDGARFLRFSFVGGTSPDSAVALAAGQTGALREAALLLGWRR